MEKLGRTLSCLILIAWAGGSSSAWQSSSGSQIAVPPDPSSIGYLTLTKRHPDAGEGAAEFATMYAPGPALQRLEQMQGFLNSFKQLTARARGRVTAVDLRAVGNTGAEVQSIGFHNIPLVVEGTLLKQDYLLKQVEYELAQVRQTRGEVGESEVARARNAYAEAAKRFQLFWDTKRPVD